MAVRKIELEKPYTYKLSTYLTDESAQTFELFFINPESGLWSRLYQATYSVQSVSVTNKKLLSSSLTSVGVNLLTYQGENLIARLGQEMQVSIILTDKTNDSKCLASPADYDLSGDLELSLKETATGRKLT